MHGPSTRGRKLHRSRLLAGLLGLAWTAACGGSGGLAEPGEAGAKFELIAFGVEVGELSWQINRPIEVRFNAPVDFSTVSSNTINIREQGTGVAATGSFGFGVDQSGAADPSIVVFHPNCPLEPAPYADAGLQPGGTHYVIRVLGKEDGASLTSAAGEPLQAGGARVFRTPQGLDPNKIFFDPVPGPPQPVVRGAGGVSLVEENATRVEIGGPAGTRLYPESPPGGGPPGLTAALPLNLYSLEESRVEVVVVFDQPVDGSPTSVSEETVRLEFLAPDDTWRPLSTRVELEANCMESQGVGAQIRVKPLGLLPPSTQMRVFVSTALKDLRGDSASLPLSNFALLETQSAFDPRFDPPDVGADEFLETFAIGGAGLESFEDTESLFADNRAPWGGDVLKAAFQFAGTGGPGGDFDWVVPPGANFVFSTDSQAITNPDQSLTVPVLGGQLDVRNFTVGEGAVLKIRGPNPFRMRVSGDATIDGVVDIKGQSSTVFPSPNAANIPHTGAGSVAGSGAGGPSSEQSATSTPRGGDGEAAFGVGVGGRGGESGFSGDPDWTLRRPGGGGGGRFGPDAPGIPGLPNAGIEAQPGFDGMDSTLFPLGTFAQPGATGAESGTIPARGGAAGSGPFLDIRDDNDFWGLALQDDGSVVLGELPHVWAGSGGGGGGDAVSSASFPNPSFADDDRGGSGGAGGGSFHLLVLGDIVFGPGGRILGDGGDGGFGGSTTILNNVGGGAGGGSGGHLVVEANGIIDLRAVPTQGLALSSRGGRGGLGMPEVEGPLVLETVGRPINRGGDGGPGIVQLHLPGETPAEQAAGVLLPDGIGTLSAIVSPPPLFMIPSFGSRSQGLSRWVSLGGASPAAGTGGEPPRFRFGGTDPADGSVLDVDEDERVDQLSPLVSGNILSSSPAGVVQVSATPLLDTDNELYLRNPALLRGFTVRVGASAWEVAQATYLHEIGRLELALVPTAGAALAPPPGPFELVPRYFRIRTSNQVDFLPSTARVQIQFQGAALDALGKPDVEDILVDWTGDVTDLDDPDPKRPLAFFRFRVLFDVDANDEGLGPGTLLPSVEFVRLPFEFSTPP